MCVHAPGLYVLCMAAGQLSVLNILLEGLKRILQPGWKKTNGCIFKQGLSLTELSTTLHGSKCLVEIVVR